jgi:anti-anti-sigma regulatory factor
MTNNVLMVPVEGTFDVPAAWRVRDEIANAAPDQPVTIDFMRVRACSAFALAALFESLAKMQPRRIQARGLSAHERRLIRYLGVELAGVVAEA